MAGADASAGKALAARCTACSTVFRVVTDQLRVSSGWVRCGRCAHVFNAAENLIDLDTGAPRRLDLATFGPAPSDNPLVPAPAAAAEPEAVSEPTPEPVAEPEPATLMQAPTPTAIVEAPTTTERPEAPQEEGVPAQPATLPSFVRRADRAARWRQPRMRAALAAGLAAAVLLLTAQIGVAYRDQVAARWPAFRPALVALCQPLACQVGPARAIESLTVESSALVRVERSNLYQLNVGLRNRAALALALPALELSLTDAQGKLLSRRVLPAREMGATQPSLAAGQDLALQATLQTAADAQGATETEDAERVVGYTIELFYP